MNNLWQPIETVPLNGETVILLWTKSKHVEDGRIFVESGRRCHVLFDGESLNDEPNYWMPFPSLPTGAQRAEALLRTLGKWEENK
jgi:hypothetical protein